MIRVKIANQQEFVPLDWAKFREIGTAVLEGEGIKEAKVTLAFVDNPTIHRLNKQYLDHVEPTDVLTFPYSGAGAKKLEGELVLGVEVAKQQAEALGHAVEAELAPYAIQGRSHLFGCDDKAPAAE